MKELNWKTKLFVNTINSIYSYANDVYSLIKYKIYNKYIQNCLKIEIICFNVLYYNTEGI